MPGRRATAAIVVGLMAMVAGCGRAPSPPAPAPAAGPTGSASTAVSATEPGVVVTVRAGGIEIQRSLPAASFTLDEAQSLDPRLPPGPFEAELLVTFDRGEVRDAYIGAEIRGGGLIVFRDEQMLRSSYAEAESKLVMTLEPVILGRPRETLKFVFVAEGPWPVQFRAMWRPLEATVAHELPSYGLGLVEGGNAGGLAQAIDRQCASCHRSDRAAVQRMLEPASAPNLSLIGQRTHPAWIRSWLTDPAAVDPTARMPRLFHGDEGDPGTIEDLTHFLSSMGGPFEAHEENPDAETVQAGRRLFHEVGCVPCHGPLETPAELFGGAAPADAPAPGRLYRSLAVLRGKTSIPALTRFLQDPLATHPDGRMPSLLLSHEEAEAIATYLDGRFATDEPIADNAFALDDERIERGRAAFERLRCGSCHQAGLETMGAGRGDDAPALESLAGAGNGCLASAPQPGVPAFGFVDVELARLAASLDGLAGWRGDSVPHDELALSFQRFNCAACHVYHSASGPEPAIVPYLKQASGMDLGPEGRLPPPLSHAGAHLTPGWLGDVLTAAGRARPYLATRMPQFGEANVGHLPALLAAAAGARPASGDAAAIDAGAAAAGEALIGGRGFNCTMCHALGDRPSMMYPGLDLLAMPHRLRYEWFARWVIDPTQVRPTTKMPAFFVGGRSGLRAHFDGLADKQALAMWEYLRRASEQAGDGSGGRSGDRSGG